MNPNFPVQGVLAVGQQHYGSAKLNIKSEKRKAQSHIRNLPYLAKGRTPYVVTSESPGPAGYETAPDFSFVHPEAWEKMRHPQPAGKEAPAPRATKKGADGAVVREGGGAHGEAPAAAGYGGAAAEAAVGAEVDGAEPGGAPVSDLGQNPQLPSRPDISEAGQEADTASAAAEVAAPGGDEDEDDDDDDDDGWSRDEDEEGAAETEEEDEEDQDDDEDGGGEGGTGGAPPEEKKWTPEELHELWLMYDNNNSGQISFAEIEKAVVEHFPEFDNREALMRAYKFADEDNSGLITKGEFTTLLRALSYFNHLWHKVRRGPRFSCLCHRRRCPVGTYLK